MKKFLVLLSILTSLVGCAADPFPTYSGLFRSASPAQQEVEVHNSTSNIVLHVRVQDNGEMAAAQVLSPGQTMIYRRTLSSSVDPSAHELRTELTAHVVGYDRETGQPIGRGQRLLLEGESGDVRWDVRRSHLELPLWPSSSGDPLGKG